MKRRGIQPVYIELMIAILMISVIGVLLLRVFVFSHQAASESEEKSRAVVLAQDNLELKVAGFKRGEITADEITQIGYDADFEPTGTDQGDYLFIIELSVEKLDYGEIMTITVSCIAAEGQNADALVTLSTKEFRADGEVAV